MSSEISPRYEPDLADGQEQPTERRYHLAWDRRSKRYIFECHYVRSASPWRRKTSRGRKRRDLEVWLGAAVAVEYAKRTLPVDAVVADLAGELSVEAERVGLNLDLTDFLIAAAARVHGLQVATLNREHFEKLGVELVEF